MKSSSKTSVEEVTTDMMGVARELELEVDPLDATNLLQSHDKSLTMSKESRFLG